MNLALVIWLLTCMVRAGYCTNGYERVNCFSLAVVLSYLIMEIIQYVVCITQISLIIVIVARNLNSGTL